MQLLAAKDRVTPYAWAYEHLLFPTWQRFVRGRPIGSQLEHVESTQWRSPEDIKELQGEALRRLLVHAGANVPYYRDLFARLRFDPRGVRSRDDLLELPVLTREIVHERYADLVCSALHSTNIRKGTSGSTGAPVQIEYSNDSESWRQAIRLRSYRWAGYVAGERTLHYWGPPAVVPRGLGALKIRLDRGLRREVYVSAAEQDEESMRATAELIRTFRPRIVIAYAQAVALFARFVLENDLRRWGDIPVICCAEPLLPQDRLATARAFGPRVFETYGCREVMLIAAECAMHDGMHLAEENLIVETLKYGRRALPGEAGDVALTDLHNYGMPLIRYSNGDLATFAALEGSAAVCRCGRGLRKLAHVDGRLTDTLHDTHGAPIPGMAFIALFAGARDLVRQFQVVQKEGGDVVLKVVRGNEWSVQAFGAIVKRMRAFLRGAQLTVEFLDTIQPAPSGKHRPVVVEPPACATTN
jgi:phenylacetate-coenzyme A ligase PaaK-like adenylate-forming protein